MHTTPSQRRRITRASLVAIAVVGLIAAAPTAFLSAASAVTGGFKTSTTVSASPTTSDVGQSVTLTAKVGITAIGGAGFTPSGSVTFSVGGVTLGTAPLKGCVVLTPCAAMLATTALPRGTDTVTASYPGDTITAPSSGTTTVTVIQVATQTAPYTQTCPAGQPCDTGVLYADDGSSTIDVAATASSGPDTINSYLGGSPLPCSTPGAGELGNYTVSATDVTKTITYSLLGSAADAFNSAHPTQPPPHVCYLATLPFSGYYPNGGNWTDTSADYVQRSTVPYNSSLGGYLGLLDACTSSHGSINNAPCVESQTFAAGASGVQDTETFVIYEAFKQHCDPHIGG
jgi:hypothetical protein